jgi:hypothetical protein
MEMKYRIYIREVCEPYSQQEWHEDYDTFEDAHNRIEKVNSGIGFNYSRDWYLQAKTIIEGVK